MSSSSTGIVSPFVVWIDNPEAGWVDVWVKQRIGHSGEHSKIVLKNVVLLNTILNEERKSFDIIDNIMLHKKVGHIMKSAGSVV